MKENSANRSSGSPFPNVSATKNSSAAGCANIIQLNCDIIGDASPAADVELIALLIDLLRAFGLTANDVVVRLSDREFWTDLLRTQNVPEDRWSELLQVIDKSEREPREKTAERLGPLADPVFEVLDGSGRSDKLDQLVSDLAQRGLAEFVKVDLSIVRGLAYYTGVVFEAFDRGRKTPRDCGWRSLRQPHSSAERRRSLACRRSASRWAMSFSVN